jgi:hypothetical protein
MTPYHFGRCNPNYWADPSGLYANDPRYLFDGLGRSKFDEFGMYIPPIDRGAARPEILTFLIENFGAGNESPTFNGNILDLGGLGFIRRVFIGNADIAPIPDFDGSFQTLSQVVIKPMYGYEFVENDVFGRTGNAFTMTGLLYDEFGNSIANSKGWINAKGNFVSKDILNIQSNGKYIRGVQGYRNGYNSALKVAGNYKAAGKIVGVLGVVNSMVDISVNGVNTSNSLDLAFGVVGLIPGGQGIALAYFLINTGVQVATGANLGQHIENIFK